MGMDMGKTDSMKKLFKRMQQMDIRSVDPDDLVDIESVKIKTDLPDEECMLDYIRQIKNPYCYKDHDVIVKISFAENGPTLEECMQEYIRAETELMS